MGYYTEINFGATLREDTPDEVTAVLSDLANGRRIRQPLDHPFFKTSRCEYLMVCSSAYFLFGEIPMPVFHFHHKCWTLAFRSSLKNYDGEIELFLDWIRPYIEEGSGANDYYAVVCTEDGLPVIYSMR